MSTREATCVHLVRHGEVDNPTNVAYGRMPGFGLTERGRRQAQATGEYLLSRAAAPLVIACSPLQRAVETATIIQRVATPGEHTPIRREPRIIESGTWIEGLPRAFAPAAYLRAYFDPAARAKSEPARDIARRMRAAIVDAIERAHSGDAAHPDGAELILVAHQSPIRFARACFEHGFATPHAGFVARNLRWLVTFPPCTHASVTTLHIIDGSLLSVSFWAPNVS